MSALRDRFLDLAGQRAADLPGAGGPLERRRAEALELFASAGLPTTRQEDWRFTSLASLEKLPLGLAERAAPAGPSTEALEDPPALTLVGGFALPAPAGGAALPPGVRVESLGSALKRDPEAVCARLGALAEDKRSPLVALNTALFEDGVWIEIPSGCQLEAPIELLFLESPATDPRASHPRCAIALGEGSRATVIEHHLGTADGPQGLTNAVSEIALGEGAELHHVSLQRQGPRHVHLARIEAAQARGSRLHSHSVALGGAIARVEIRVALREPEAHATLNGLYWGRETQLVDHHTTVLHEAPSTTSDELYKGILDGRAHGVFHGRIHVAPRAQKIDAAQQNRTLFLADGPTINSKPQLEIYADDVRCSHGATVGQLDAQALFYLRSRGIGEPNARALLTLGFAREIAERLPTASLRRAAESWAGQWLGAESGESAS